MTSVKSRWVSRISQLREVNNITADFSNCKEFSWIGSYGEEVAAERFLPSAGNSDAELSDSPLIVVQRLALIGF